MKYLAELAMENTTIKQTMQSASEKMASGALMTIEETAAWFDISSKTVHRLPLPTIRLGNSLRFDPADVRKLIEISREPAILA
jgi:hypothetical protein